MSSLNHHTANAVASASASAFSSTSTLAASSSSNRPGARPRNVVAVIGTTGVGKSDLAVTLARSLLPSKEGIVLSADSMQLYKGLDVITNKMTAEEMKGVRHWGMDLVTPGQGSWEVGRWCSQADRVMEELGEDEGQEGVIPIVCGGTHYFIQHFLIPPESLSFERPKPANDHTKRWEPPHPRPPIPKDLNPELERLLDTFWTDHPIWPGGTEEGTSVGAGPSNSSRPTIEDDSHLLALHQLLHAIDLKEAGRWHWRDGRKVRRGIERWWETNGAQSEPEVRKSVGSGGRKARFRTLVFWVYETLETLRPRLSKRVDKMVENGLPREIAELRAIATRLYRSPSATDHNEGIFQSIGYKEFANLNLDQEDPSSDPSFESMLDRMKLSTHQYAKSQIKWIRKQLLPAIKEARSLGGDVEVYVVRGGREGEELATGILDAFLKGEPMPDRMKVGHPDSAELLAELAVPDEARVPDIAQRQEINQRRDCKVCSTADNPISISLKDWDTHIKSKSHKTKATIQNAGGIEAWIRQQRERGIAKKEERRAVKGHTQDPERLAESHT